MILLFLVGGYVRAVSFLECIPYLAFFVWLKFAGIYHRRLFEVTSLLGGMKNGHQSWLEAGRVVQMIIWVVFQLNLFYSHVRKFGEVFSPILPKNWGRKTTRFDGSHISQRGCFNHQLVIGCRLNFPLLLSICCTGGLGAAACSSDQVSTGSTTIKAGTLRQWNRKWVRAIGCGDMWRGGLNSAFVWVFVLRLSQHFLWDLNLHYRNGEKQMLIQISLNTSDNKKLIKSRATLLRGKTPFGKGGKGMATASGRLQTARFFKL